MKLKASKIEVEKIRIFRSLYLSETNFQIRYNACFERGWTDTYLLTVDDSHVGYGAVKGQELPDRDTIFEFFVIAPFRKFSNQLFQELISESGVRYIECQSNDLLLSPLIFEFAEVLSSEVMLFDDDMVTEYSIPGVVFRPRKKDDIIFNHTFEPPGDYVLEKGGEVVATGGYMLYYNMPFADIYMEVKEDFRRQGLGSYIVQELKKSCYLSGRVPAARCDIQNYGSRGALTKAGLKVCGFMIKGSNLLKSQNNKF